MPSRRTLSTFVLDFFYLCHTLLNDAVPSYCKNKACAFTLVIIKSTKLRIFPIYVLLVLRFLIISQAVSEISERDVTEVADPISDFPLRHVSPMCKKEKYKYS